MEHIDQEKNSSVVALVLISAGDDMGSNMVVKSYDLYDAKWSMVLDYSSLLFMIFDVGYVVSCHIRL